MTVVTPYKAIADDTRRDILDLLRTQTLTAGDIAGRFKRDLSRPAISKHLRILRRSRLVTVKKSGRERVYALNPQPLEEVNVWLKQYETFWDQQLAAFKNYVETETKKESSTGK